MDNFYSVYLCAQIQGTQGEYRDNYILVGPDCGGLKRVEHYAQLLKMNYVVMNKKRDLHKI